MARFWSVVFFTSIGGQTRNNIARLNADGTADSTFNANANNSVNSISTQSDGKILVSGGFTSIADNLGIELLGSMLMAPLILLSIQMQIILFFQ